MKKWISTKKALPKEGKYVLIHIKGRPWHDSRDGDGVFYDVAMLVSGISQADRKAMQEGRKKDPMTGGHRRSDIICPADEWGNNRVPYRWETFGPCSYFGQEVDYWKEFERIRKLRRKK